MKTLLPELYAPICYWADGCPGLDRNGCGPNGMGWLVGDNYLGVAVAEPCNIHDICYDFLAKGLTFSVVTRNRVDSCDIKSRADADGLFFHNLRIQADGCGILGFAVRNIVAPVMWGAVRILGWMNC